MVCTGRAGHLASVVAVREPYCRCPCSPGLQALSDGRNEDALVDFTKATEAQADFAEAWNKQATVNYLLGRYDVAVLDIQKTLELEPRHFGALSGLGLISLALGREREA